MGVRIDPPTTPCKPAPPEVYRNPSGYAMAKSWKTLHHDELAKLRERPSKRHVAAHRCRSRDCIALDHLFWATYEQNAYDRKTQGTETYGERNGRATITADDVRQIRALASEGWKHQRIADEVGTSRPNVANIVARRRWPHIE